MAYRDKNKTHNMKHPTVNSPPQKKRFLIQMPRPRDTARSLKCCKNTTALGPSGFPERCSSIGQALPPRSHNSGIQQDNIV